MFTVMQSVYHDLNLPTFIKTIKNILKVLRVLTLLVLVLSLSYVFFSLFEVKLSIYEWYIPYTSLKLRLVTFSSSVSVCNWNLLKCLREGEMCGRK